MNFTPELMEASFKMITGLVIVLGTLLVIWYLARKVARKNGEAFQSRRIRVLANQCIGLKKNIALVQVPGSILVLGLTHDRINCLTKISKEDWPDEEAAISAQGPVSSFMSQLKSEMAGRYRKAGRDGQTA